MIIVYITNPSVQVARRISKILLEKKLIPCANIFPIDSIYRWEGQIKEEKEWVLLAKTRAELYKRIAFEVKKAHPYKIPCIAKFDAAANEDYVQWIREETIREDSI